MTLGIVSISNQQGIDDPYLSLAAISAKLALVWLIGFGVTCLAVPLCIKAARAFRILDTPDARRIHREPTPRGGGLGVAAGVLTAVAASHTLIAVDPASTMVGWSWWGAVIPAAALILATGLLDDIFGLSAFRKLVLQILAVDILFVAGIRIGSLFGVELSPAADLGLMIVWFVIVTNAFNLIDGIDGLCSGLAGIAAFGLAGSLMLRDRFFEASVLLGFVGACAGFLVFNRHPAKIFLGDTGSNFIGFFLAASMLQTGSKSSGLAFICIPLFALSVPVIDTLLAIWRRSARVAAVYLLSGTVVGGVMSADLDHVHHRLLRLGLSHRDVSASLYLLNAILVLIGLVMVSLQDEAWTLLLLALLLVAYAGSRILPSAELWPSGLVILHAIGRPKRMMLALVVYLVMDVVCLVAAMSFALLLVHQNLPAAVVFAVNWPLVAWWVLAGVSLLVGIEGASFLSARFGSSRVTMTVVALCQATALGLVIAELAASKSMQSGAAVFVLGLLLSVAFLGGARLTVFLVERVMIKRMRHAAIDRDGPPEYSGFYSRLTASDEELGSPEVKAMKAEV